MKKDPQPLKKAFVLLYHPKTPPGLSPYRLFDLQGSEIKAVNDFLDAQATRELSLCSLRTYGYSLLNFWRWLSEESRDLFELTEDDFLKYVRFQKQDPSTAKEITAKTINHRLTAARCLYRFHCGADLPSKASSYPGSSHPYHSSAASKNGYLYPARRRRLQLRLRIARKCVVPLKTEEVQAFLKSLRTSRDLSIAAFMLFCGLRSREVIELKLKDLSFIEGEVRLRGKGNKERLLPLPPDLSALVQNYLEVERPPSSAPELFVSLKGKKRGQAMTTAGLRSLFRHHRSSAHVPMANPHRFRHTFGTEMARAGISLPALMKLMGHADINTTMIYVELSPKHVWDAFLEASRLLRKEKYFEGD